MGRDKGFRSGRHRKIRYLKRSVAISLLFLIISIIPTFIYVEKNLEPALRAYAEEEMRVIATKAINQAVDEKLTNIIDFRELVEFQNYGGVITGNFNTTEYTHIMNEATLHIEQYLDKISEKEVEIPLGQALNSSILAEITPDIPIRLKPLGTIETTLTARLKNAGINIVMITVYIDIKTTVAIVTPFTTQPTVIRNEHPLTQAVVVGNVPQFYIGAPNEGTGGNAKDGQEYNFIPPIQLPNLQPQSGSGQPASNPASSSDTGGGASIEVQPVNKP
jgi:sporulation protein YunB